MTLSKAIEIIDLNIKEAGRKMPPDCVNALQLGIEALREIQRARVVSIFPEIHQLPGETEEPG